MSPFSLALLSICTLVALPGPATPVRDRWDFKFRKFVIGAWWGPDATDAEMKAYRAAGFNVVMTGRYMQLDDYGNADKALKELNLARKHGLGVLYDTYTKNDRPWGGKADPYEPHAIHHPATLTELKWLHDRIGRHPALVGFMIGDDQGAVGERSKACTDFLFERRPHLIPWLCGWIDPGNLAANNNPVGNPQIYPTLYEWGLPAEDLAQRYCAAYASYSKRCRENGVIFWPMFNVAGDLGKLEPDMGGCIPTDSLLRLPAYAALAYGAEGIWYFIYNSGALQHLGPHKTGADVARALTPLYPVAQRVNRRIASWGPLVLGRTCEGIFGTAFPQRSDWPFAEDLPPYGESEDLAAPAAGKLIEAMDGELIVGILAKAGKRPLAMVVDCRAAKSLNALPERDVTIRFAPTVKRVRVLEGGRATVCRGNSILLHLEAGGGQMLELDGAGLDRIAVRAAIYKPVVQRAAPSRPVAVGDIAGATAAKIRLDVFGSNGGQYAEKWVLLNGVRIGRVAVTNSDAWVVTALDLSPEQLAALKPVNEIVVTNEGGDAWKLRNVAIAIRKPDGTWAKTAAFGGVHSSPNWAHSEGTPFDADGRAGPIMVRIGP